MSATVTRPSARPTAPARHPAPPPRPPAPATPQWRRLAPRMLTLAALGGYAALRWSTLVRPQAAGAMLGLLAIALAAAGAVRALARLPRPLLPLGGALAALAWLVLSALVAGAPPAAVDDVRHWGDLAAGIQQGLADLPRVLVPYQAADPWPRIVIVLGGGLLLACAALVATAARRASDAQRMLASVPLVAMAVVPATILHERAPVVQGAVLFFLLAAFLWLERLPRADVRLALGAVALAGVVGMLAAPALDGPRPWIDAQSLVEGLDHPDPSRFDWSQRYGPLNSARDGREVLRVSSPQPLYWKTENLDGFDGLRWFRIRSRSDARPWQEVPHEALATRRWRTTIRVTMRAMGSADVIGAGTTLQVDAPDNQVTSDGSPGTWVAGHPLGPGDAYTATVLEARPTAAELYLAGTSYPEMLRPYLMLGMPSPGPGGAWMGRSETVDFPTFGTPVPPPRDDGLAQTLAAGPYARAFALSRELAAGAMTPYGYVQRILAYLARGFTYSETPPQRAVPLESFLFRDRAGYCQQFAGAAALLLRMGGVPARVATGFTTGARDGTRNEYVVRDTNAHAWVEAWFPHYGWVQFDPTPASAPARSGRAARAIGDGTAQLLRDTVPTPNSSKLNPATPAPAARPSGGGTAPGWLFAAALGVAAAAAGAPLVLRRRRRRPRGPADRLLAELEGALRRTGRAPDPSLTLRQLERRFRHAPEAAAYVRTLRLARYANADPHVTPRQRRALRAELASGLGVAGRLRALVALPPRLR